MDIVVRLPNLRFPDDGLLAFGLLTVGFDGDDVRGVHGPHDVEVLELVAHLYELHAGGLNAHWVFPSRVLNDDLVADSAAREDDRLLADSLLPSPRPKPPPARASCP